MTIDEHKSKINAAMFNSVTYGLEIFACLKTDTSFELKKFTVNDPLRDSLKNDILTPVIQNKFICDDVELDTIDNVADNRNVLYYIEQNEEFIPFAPLDSYNNITISYREQDQDKLLGFAFRVNTNSNFIWLYQQVYQMHMVKRSKHIYSIFNGTTYVPLEKDVLKFNSHIDIVIIGNTIITRNLQLLQKEFGFQKYVRSEARKVISVIDTLGIVADTSKIIQFENKEKLTNAKKLLKVKNSVVLKIPKEKLISAIKSHPRYKDKFRFENDQIIITTYKDVTELLKMMDDDILHSDLTGQEYDSSYKKILDPISQQT